MKLTAALLILSLLPGIGAVTQLPAELRRDGPVLREVLDPVQKSLQDHSAVFYDAGNRKYFVYGTVMTADGYILTKASELAEVKKFTVRIGKQHFRRPKLVATDWDWDLTLVKVDATDLKAVEWGNSQELERGTWVVSNGSTQRRLRRVRPGVISANARKISGPLLVVLGIGMDEKEGKLTIKSVTKDSGAARAGLKADDILEYVEGEELKERDQLLEILKKKLPWQRVDVLVTRGEEKYSCRVQLMPRHKVFKGQVTRNDQMSGVISVRRTNFPKVLQHDTTSSARNMGGPLVTLDGVCIGMNIACANRVEAYAIPAEELKEAFQKLLQKDTHQ